LTIFKCYDPFEADRSLRLWLDKETANCRTVKLDHGNSLPPSQETKSCQKLPKSCKKVKPEV